jgi:hypothetical protein
LELTGKFRLGACHRQPESHWQPAELQLSGGEIPQATPTKGREARTDVMPVLESGFEKDSWGFYFEFSSSLKNLFGWDCGFVLSTWWYPQLAVHHAASRQHGVH